MKRAGFDVSGIKIRFYRNNDYNILIYIAEVDEG